MTQTALPTIDFLSKRLRHRLEQATLRNELLARAIGMKPKDHPSIVDATAGLGTDSFVLATLGFHLTLLERSPELYHLLKAALERATAAFPETIARLKLIQADAAVWLSQLNHDQRPDVIYLDPMFPVRKKAASVRKNMAIMQELLGKANDHAELFNAALHCAKHRVVVKRPRLAPKIIEHEPNFSLNGRTCRFDVYLITRMP
jgi:16S rRNA (guanine1516-N2)-methyltransferase